MEIVMCIDVGKCGCGYKPYFEQDAPSCLLLKQDKTIQAFGYEAERRYLALLDNKQHDQFYYFRRFKADLKTKQFRKDTVIEEEGGKSINGIALFKEVFKYLRGHFMDTLDESARYGNMDAVGGLTPCVLYSETEAAARYCRLIPLRLIKTAN
ncbi:hypothetical protein MAR_023857 [Mya arenaria]|uniref:Uncharacterized protein n=1 Tax=Mya arenaria TaxID=6604 RepID=A0ABY7DSB6_MYAAR|nr:hypothetical protein MAR_023857 [Mya arenaria]